MMKDKTYRVVLVSPSWVISRGLSQIIGENRDLDVIDTLSDLSSLSNRHMSNYRADVVILDPSAASAAGIHSLRDYYEPLKDFVLVGALNAAYSQEILAQFDSYFTINDTPAQIVGKIRKAIESSGSSEAPKESDAGILSSREKEILAEVARGYTNKEIADKLNISVFTVTTHRKNISQKLGIRSIAGLTVYAVMNHIVSEEEFK